MGSDPPLDGAVRGSPPRGFVLPTVLLCLLALTAMAHGILVLAQHHERAGRAGVAAVQVRLASEGAVRRGRTVLDDGEAREALREGEVLHLQPAPVGTGSTARATVERIRPEWLWIEGVGTVDRGNLTAGLSTGAIFWSLEEGARIGALRAGLEHGGSLIVTADAAVLGSGSLGAPEDWPADVCAPHEELLDSLLAPDGLPATALFTEGTTGSGDESELVGLEAVPRLGLLDGAVLEERATLRLVDDRITPRPSASLTTCDTGPDTNWGAPDDPTGPCGGYLPLLVAPGSLRVDGGQGQGILVVGGDLTLTDDARFVGLVLVGGSLEVGPRARLQGAARVREQVMVSGRVEASPCGALRAVNARDDLSRPLSAPGGGWIPVP